MVRFPQMEDNLSYMKNFKDMNLIPCTACRCCTAGCPKQIPIRKLLKDVAAEFEKKRYRFGQNDTDII